MKLSGSTSCTDGFKKTLRMMRFCGIVPLDELCHLRPVVVIPSCLMYIVLLSLLGWWIWSRYIGFLEGDIVAYLSCLRMCCSFISLITITFHFARKRGQLRAVLWSLIVIDKELFKANLPWEWSVNTEVESNFIVAMALLVSNFISYGVQDTLSVILFYIVYMLIIFNVAQFCSFLKLIEYCLKQISFIENRESLPKLYSILESFWLVVNDIYGQGIACLIVSSYLGALNHLYDFASMNTKWHIGFSFILSVTAYIMIKLQLIMACQKLKTQVRKFNLHLYNKQKQCKKLLDSEELKFHFESMEEFEFTAYHFFPVNVSLIGSMILSGTTYLVTLLQFTPSGIQKS